MKKFLLSISLILLIGFPLAYGHPFLLESDPPAAATVPAGVTQVTIQYSEAVEVDFSVVKVFDSTGEQIDNKDTKYFQGETSLMVTTPPLEDGVYTVTTKVLSKVDGHLVDYAIIFGVGDVAVDVSSIEQPKSSESTFVPEAVSRFPGLVGQTIVLGAGILSFLVWNGITKKKTVFENLKELQESYRNKFSSIIGIGILLVFASNIAMLVVQVLRLETTAIEAIQTSFGFTWSVRMGLTFALLAVWFFIGRRNNMSPKKHILLIAVSLALISTTTMMGHGAASEQLSAIILDYVHNLLSAVWIGGIIYFGFTLLPTIAKIGNKKEAISLLLIPQFSSAITIALGVLVITGPTLLWLLESNVSSIMDSTYGLLIFLKILIGGIMIGLGAYKQFGIQRPAEKNLKSGKFQIFKRLRRSLAIETVLGVILLAVVALLTNSSLPAGEIQQVEAQEVKYGFETISFSQNAKFGVNIFPFTSGTNTISVIVSDAQGEPLPDMSDLKLKISNPVKGIAPIEIPMNLVQKDDEVNEYQGEITFGFSGQWQIEVEAQRTQNANENISLNVLVKPRLQDLRTEMIEYDLPEEATPLFPIYDGDDSIWISDPSKPRIWKFSISDESFESFEYEGLTSITLAIDNDGNIWFVDIPKKQIGFINHITEEIKIVPLPTDGIAIALEPDMENNIWITITDKNLLLRYLQDTEEFEEYTIPTEDSGPFALVEDSGGNIWFSETISGKIGYISPKTGEIREFVPEIPLKGPEAMIFDSDGILWIAEHTGTAITKFDPLLETFERVQVPDPESLPFGMTFDRFENIWFAQHVIDKIAAYDPHNKNIIEVDIPTEASFTQFTTSDSNGNIWFVEQQGNKLGMIKISEVPGVKIAKQSDDKPSIRYMEISFPLISAGIVLASLFFVKSINHKRKLDSLIP